MSQYSRAERESINTIAALAGVLVGLCNRAKASVDERRGIIDMLVTLGFDDSDEEGSTLDAIERGRSR